MVSSGKATSSAPPSTARCKASAAFSTFPHTSPTTVSIWANATFISLTSISLSTIPKLDPLMITPDTVARGGFSLRKRALWDRIRGVDSEEEQQRTTGDPSPPSPATTLCGAALAAELLENACAPGSEDSLRIEVVRTLARDLKVELE